MDEKFKTGSEQNWEGRLCEKATANLKPYSLKQCNHPPEAVPRIPGRSPRRSTFCHCSLSCSSSQSVLMTREFPSTPRTDIPVWPSCSSGQESSPLSCPPASCGSVALRHDDNHGGRHATSVTARDAAMAGSRGAGSASRAAVMTAACVRHGIGGGSGVKCSPWAAAMAAGSCTAQRKV